MNESSNHFDPIVPAMAGGGGSVEVETVRGWLEERGLLAEEALLVMLQTVHALWTADENYLRLVAALRATATAAENSTPGTHSLWRVQAAHAMADLLMHAAILPPADPHHD